METKTKKEKKVSPKKSKVRKKDGNGALAGWTCHSLDFLHVLCGVLVGHVGGADVKLEIRSVVLKVVVVGQLCETESKSTMLRNKRRATLSKLAVQM